MRALLAVAFFGSMAATVIVGAGCGGSGTTASIGQVVQPKHVVLSPTPSPSPSPSSTPILLPSPSPTATLAITSWPPPSGSVGVAYGNSHILWTCYPASSRCVWGPSGNWIGFQLIANRPYLPSGILASLRWSWSSVAGSSLPAGLAISNPFVLCSFGRCDCWEGRCGYAPAIVGTPTAPGTYHVIVTVTGYGSKASASYTITITR